MNTSRFIAKRLSFRGKTATVCVAVSFFVIILAQAISNGFRHEIREGISSLCGDISLESIAGANAPEALPIPARPAFLDRILAQDGVERVDPVIYRIGILKTGDDIHGVLFKGVADYVPADTARTFPVRIPRKLSRLLHLSTGDDVPAYFVGGERIKARKFTVDGIYDGILEEDDKLVAYVPLPVMQRLAGWDEDRAGALEIRLKPGWKTPERIRERTELIGSIANMYSRDEDPSLLATSCVQKYPQVFDWLRLIDANVLLVLILMTIVAGFNMISGLLILLFEHISTIGLLKALGMRDGGISRIFLNCSSRLVLRGVLFGNLAALAVCALQHFTHLLRLDPANYFVSFVPVRTDWMQLLLTDAACYAVIMLLLWIPCRFISRVDPAETVRTE